jgi:hypothetical protein
MPESVPLDYTLTVAACLSQTPADRPTFEELLVLLEDMEREAARGQYVNSAAIMKVRSHIFSGRSRRVCSLAKLCSACAVDCGRVPEPSAG